MAVRDGVVAWLGSDDVGRAQFGDAEIVDLDGAFVAPAFVDSHVHLTSTGLLITGLDLAAATSKQHCLALVAEHVAAHPGQPIWGHGWDDTGWPADAAPTTAELDAVVGAVPAYLARVDVHSALASTALRELVPGLPAVAGFDPQRPLSADAHHLVRAEARGLLTWQQRDDARRAALDAVAAAGIVAVHECAGPAHRRIRGLAGAARHRARRRGRRLLGRGGLHARRRPGRSSRTTGARGLAGDLFVDGALGSHTAWLCEPYADAPDACGNCYLDADTITEHLIACTEAGVTAGFHVIGDAAVTAVVDALRTRRRDVRCAGGGPLRAPARASGDGDRRAGRQAGPVGCHRQHAAQFRRVVGRQQRDVRPAPRDRQSRPAQPAGAVSIGRRAPRVRLRCPGDQHQSVGDGARGQPPPHARAARSRCAPPSRRPPAAPGGPAACATASPARSCPARPPRMRCGRPASSRSARRPTASSGGPPTRGPGCRPCRASIPTTRCRAAGRPCTEVSCSMADGMPGWLRRFAGAFPPRAMRLLVTVTAGLLLCISFPPIGWWWSAIVSVRAAELGADRIRGPRSPVASATASCSGWRSTFRCCRGSADSSGRSRGWRCRRWRRCSPRCSGCSPWWCAGCRAGRCGSRCCGRCRSG